jgi:hypothetical protein
VNISDIEELQALESDSDIRRKPHLKVTLNQLQIFIRTGLPPDIMQLICAKQEHSPDAIDEKQSKSYSNIYHGYVLALLCV